MTEETAVKIELPLKVEYDEDQAVRDWQATDPRARIIKRHPVQMLSLRMKSCRPGQKLLAEDQFSVMIEYELE
jgi:hypothetical protein